MLTLLQWPVVAVGLLAVAVTLLALHWSPHWLVRIWDFPRVQIAVLAGMSAALYAIFFFRAHPAEWVFLAATVLAMLWQCRKIYPYTPPAPTRVKRTTRPHPEATIKLLICNVLRENREYDRVLRVVQENDPDLFLAVETDDAWLQALEPLARTHPHTVLQPQDNYYGMVLFSRFPLVDPQVKFLVQEDVPSIHTAVELPSGDRILLHGLHPRPPEPIRDQPSTPRDAELVIVGRAIGDEEDCPTVVAGDLNDVAWSPTSQLFLRLSGLLDPRMGRGFYNSFNANNPLFRYPLDHVFHSNDFKLVALRRLEHIGSDHFPMFIQLSYEPEAEAEQPEPRKRSGDERKAQEKVEEQVAAAQTGEDRPSGG
jgi:endonuclease/exonuclease/phosphatase (EEP) superfamily protein YafD